MRRPIFSSYFEDYFLNTGNSLGLFYIILLSLLFSCKEKSKYQIPDQIVLIFESAPINTVHTFPSGVWTTSRRSEEISFFDDHGIKHHEALTHLPYDTIILKTTRKKVEVTHLYNGIEKLCFVFQIGDIALFTYDGQKPRAKILNRDFSEMVLNYDLNRLERFGDGDFSEYIKFNNPWFFYDFDFKSGNLTTEVEKVLRLTTERAIEILKYENSFLDSLKMHGQISMDEMQYLKKRSILDLKLMALHTEIGFRPLQKLPKELSSADFNLTTKGLLELENQATELHAIKSDSDHYFQFHEKLLDWLLYNYYSRKVGRVTSAIYNNGVQGAGSNMPNYCDLYDTIKSSQLIGSFDKKVLLMKTMEELIPTVSLDQRKSYFEKFKEDTHDSAMISSVAEKFHLGGSLTPVFRTPYKKVSNC